MSTLSPAAQAVVDAFLLSFDHEGPQSSEAVHIAAALCAAVEQVLPIELGLPEQAPMQGHVRQDQRGKTRRELLAIATELEAAS